MPYAGLYPKVVRAPFWHDAVPVIVDNAMGRLWWRRTPHQGAVSSPARGGRTAYAALAVLAAGSLLHYIPGPTRGGVSYGPAKATAAFHHIVLPDLAVFQVGGISDASLDRIRAIHGVGQFIALDGAQVTSGGARVNVIGVNPQQFRSWTPLDTASNQKLWNALDAGGFIASPSAQHQLRLHKGHAYSLTGAATVSLNFAGAAPLGMTGIDMVVSDQVSAKLGLIHNLAALISAPGLSIATLRHDVRAALHGSAAKLIRLRPRHAPPLVAGHVPSGKPTTYIQLFQESAARYCPGLPWEVLAAIGQIESGDRANPGVSTAGALGPMQFLPSTWAEWGITAFGEKGPPNIMDPFDAVPSAARYLCAAGGSTAAGLPRAIFAYNHADWYVNEVLALARQYQQAYG
jgi:transglycosylase-like protein with SLT domain